MLPTHFVFLTCQDTLKGISYRLLEIYLNQTTQSLKGVKEWVIQALDLYYIYTHFFIVLIDY